MTGRADSLVARCTLGGAVPDWWLPIPTVPPIEQKGCRGHATRSSKCVYGASSSVCSPPRLLHAGGVAVPARIALLDDRGEARVAGDALTINTECYVVPFPDWTSSLPARLGMKTWSGSRSSAAIARRSQR